MSTDKADLNKKDIEHLEEKMDNVKKEVKRVDENTPDKEDLVNLRNTINKVVLEGNGNQALTVRVQKNASKINNLQKRVNAIWGFIISIMGLIGSCAIKIFTKWL